MASTGAAFALCICAKSWGAGVPGSAQTILLEQLQEQGLQALGFEGTKKISPLLLLHVQYVLDRT
jgi:hypothetical protein